MDHFRDDYFGEGIGRYDEYEDDIIIILYDEVILTSSIEDKLTFDGKKYKLRFVTSSETLSGVWNWDVVMYCCHGGF